MTLVVLKEGHDRYYFDIKEKAIENVESKSN